MLKFEHNSDGTVIEATGELSEVLADLKLRKEAGSGESHS